MCKGDALPLSYSSMIRIHYIRTVLKGSFDLPTLTDFSRGYRFER